jgi:small neutral amino acid transporter SnatA (MarC family)
MLKLNEVKALDGQRVERALIGFVAGGLMGVGFSYLFLRITNLIYAWIGREPIQITWRSVLPFALILGLSMAINMAHPPFGD